MRRLLGPVALIAGLFGVVSSAHAAGGDLYASPNGVGDCSSAAQACMIDVALAGGMPTDTVHLAGGTYDIGLGVTVPGGVTLRGAGPDETELHLSGDTTSEAAQIVVQSGAHVEELTATSSITPGVSALDARTLVLQGDAVAHDVIAKNTPAGPAEMGQSTTACAGSTDAVWSNVVCYATEDYAMSLDATAAMEAGAINSSTLVGRGGRPALYVVGTGGTLTIDDSILTGEDKDIDVGGTLALTITTSNYNYTAMTEPPCAGGCTDDAPVFASIANEDFHALPESTGTVDKGSESVAGTDLDGNRRTIGTATDMGAYELPAEVTAHTDPASNITETSAHISGTANGGGAYGATYQVKSGATTLDGATLPVDSGDFAFSGNVTGLSPDTQYTVNLVVENSRGQKTFPVTFTTKPTPVIEEEPPVHQPPVQEPPKKVLIAASWDTNAVVDTFKVSIKLKSRAIRADSKGRFTLTLVSKTPSTISGSLSSWKPVGNDDDFVLKPNASKKIRLKLTNAALKSFKKDKDRKMAATAVATVAGADGSRKQVFLDFTLKR